MAKQDEDHQHEFVLKLKCPKGGTYTGAASVKHAQKCSEHHALVSACACGTEI